MDTRGIDQMLSELRATSQVASGKAAQAATAAGETDFGQVLQRDGRDTWAMRVLSKRVELPFIRPIGIAI